MNEPQVLDPRRRIRELQAIPERDRTDEQWDELNELEIRTAPGNREVGPAERSPDGRQGFANHGRRPERSQSVKNPRLDSRPDLRVDARPQEPRVDGRPTKRQHRRPKRPVETPGNS